MPSGLLKLQAGEFLFIYQGCSQTLQDSCTPGPKLPIPGYKCLFSFLTYSWQQDK